MAKKKQIELTIEEKLQNALVPKEEQPYKIPNNWCWTKLENISEKIVDGDHNPPRKEKKSTVYIMLSAQNIGYDTLVNLDKVRYLSEENFHKINKRTELKQGDVLFSSVGSIGNAVVYEKDKYSGKQITFQRSVTIIKTRIDSYFLRYILLSPYCQGIFKRQAIGTAQKGFYIKQMNSLMIPLPPLNEQQRIVERIESLFVKLDRAKELIENTLAQFEQNKMAILHKAFTGELTAKWRKENNIDLSSWENGILMDFCKINPKKINTKEFDDDMIVSFIPMPCVSDIWGKIVKKELRKLGEVKKGYTNFCEGDVLFAKITPCMENGKSAIVDKLENDIGFGSTEFYVLRCDENKLNNKYLHYFVRQKTFRDEAKGEMTGAVGQQRVPKTFLENYKMKVPTIKEQQEIVNILDRLLAKYNKIKNLEQQLEKIELLKKAILAKAFRGELGTNNPDEESAEVLLRGILAEK